MRNIKQMLALLMLTTFVISCDTDGGTSEIDVIEGAVPNLTLNSEYATILNLNELNQGNDVDFGFTVDIEMGDVESADLVGFYQTADGHVYGPEIFVSDINEFPAEISMSTEDVIANFSELNSLEDFQLGDQLILTTTLYLSDGRTLNILNEDASRNYASDIHTSGLYNVVASYPVGCPLNGSFAGEYRVTATGPNSGFGLFSAPEFTVELEETSQTLRSFDFTYLPDYNFGVTATLEFICDRVIMQTTDSGVGCGGGTITFGSTDDGTDIDFSDDSGFTLTITDFISDGACGVASRDVTLTFEKI